MPACVRPKTRSVGGRVTHLVCRRTGVSFCLHRIGAEAVMPPRAAVLADESLRPDQFAYHRRMPPVPPARVAPRESDGLTPTPKPTARTAGRGAGGLQRAPARA